MTRRAELIAQIAASLASSEGNGDTAANYVTSAIDILDEAERREEQAIAARVHRYYAPKIKSLREALRLAVKVTKGGEADTVAWVEHLPRVMELLEEDGD